MLIKQWLLSAHVDHDDDDTTEGVDDLASQLEELCSHYAAEYGLRIYYEDKEVNAMADQRYHYKAGYGPTECGIDFDTDNYKATADVAEVTCRECLEGIFRTITANPKLRRRFVIATINPQVH